MSCPQPTGGVGVRFAVLSQDVIDDAGGRVGVFRAPPRVSANDDAAVVQVLGDGAPAGRGRVATSQHFGKAIGWEP